MLIWLVMLVVVVDNIIYKAKSPDLEHNIITLSSKTVFLSRFKIVWLPSTYDKKASTVNLTFFTLAALHMSKIVS